MDAIRNEAAQPLTELEVAQITIGKLLAESAEYKALYLEKVSEIERLRKKLDAQDLIIAAKHVDEVSRNKQRALRNLTARGVAL
jgi:aspartate ammonia-lyase